MIKQTVLFEITVDDENIIELYPNYRFNWGTPQEFIQFLIEDFDTSNNVNPFTGEPEDHLESFGYSIRAITREEAKVMDSDLEVKTKLFGDYNIGDLVVHEGVPCQVCDIDSDDKLLFISNDNHLEDGFWVGIDELS